MIKIAHIIWEADLRSRHPGLKLQAKKVGIVFDDMRLGELILFLNTKLTQVAILAKSKKEDTLGVVSYYKREGDRRLPMDAIQYIPQTFGSDGADVTAAIRKALEKRFGKEETHVV